MTHSYTARKTFSEAILKALTEKGATITNVIERTISKRGSPLRTEVVHYVILKSIPNKTFYLSYEDVIKFANTTEEA